jgi:2-hydroxycyclohexanecarboxyl-CoA dehydrogenase
VAAEMTATALDGQTALVTGAAQGIGLGIALALAAAGADVALLDTNGAAASEAAAAVRARGRRALPLVADVTDLARVDAAIAEAVTALGRLDVLVNNAGWTPNEPFAGSAPETWRRIVDVNFMGVLNCTRAALGTMIPARRGRVVSIASDAGRVGTPREAVYAGAKAAIVGFSKSLAAEVARHGITVNVVSPATVDTPLLRGMLSPEQIERREKANPMGRLGRPEDVAAAVLYFCSPGAGYVTGQVLSVNGGVVRAG